MTTSSTAALADQAMSKLSAASRRYGGLSSDERSQQRRQKLLDAAVEVFGTLGLRKATMRDVCNEARIAERYFSEHFVNMAEAYEAAFKLISEQAIVVTGAAMAKAPLNTHDMAKASLSAFFRFVKEDPRRAQILLIDSSSYWRHVTVRTNPELTKQAVSMRYFCELIYPDLPKKIELEIIGAALIGTSLQSCLAWVQNGFKQPIDVVVNHLMFAWDGLDRWFREEIEASKAAAAARKKAPTAKKLAGPSGTRASTPAPAAGKAKAPASKHAKAPASPLPAKTAKTAAKKTRDTAKTTRATKAAAPVAKPTTKKKAR